MPRVAVQTGLKVKLGSSDIPVYIEFGGTNYAGRVLGVAVASKPGFSAEHQLFRLDWHQFHGKKVNDARDIDSWEDKGRAFGFHYHVPVR